MNNHISKNTLNYIRRLFPIVFILISLSGKGQYRELIYYRVPVGAIKYFHPDETVFFKLKSEDKFDVRKGTIRLITDTSYEIGNVRFKPDNLKWISTKPSIGLRVLKNFAGSLIIATGIASIAYGISVFPNDELKKKDKDAFHNENVKAINYCLGGLALAAISIPVYGIHPRRYSVSKKWRVKYQR